MLAVHPDRSYSRGGRTTTNGDAVYVDLGSGRNSVALLAHIDKSLDLDGTNYVALRAYRAAGRNVPFSHMNQVSGKMPVKENAIPVLVTFGDPADPGTARRVGPDEVEGSGVGKGIRLRGISAEAIPNGLWPLDFGGALGEPVTRGIEARLPWLKGPDEAAGRALKAAGLPSGESVDPKQAFTRK